MKMTLCFHISEIKLYLPKKDILIPGFTKIMHNRERSVKSNVTDYLCLGLDDYKSNF